MKRDSDPTRKPRALPRERGISSNRPYRLPSRRLGLRPGIDVEHALRLAADLEDAETIQKLALDGRG
jgi:hypothetical protein